MMYQCLTTEPATDKRLILDDEVDPDTDPEDGVKKKKKKAPDSEEDPDTPDADEDDLDDEDDEVDDEDPEINLGFK